MISKWPEFSDEFCFEKEEECIELIKESVRAIRNTRAEMNIPIGKKAAVYVVSESREIRDIFEEGLVYFQTLAKASSVSIQADKNGIGEDAVSIPLADVVICIPLEELIDLDRELERLEGEKKRLEGELKRVDGMLGNEKFMSKAPEAKITEEREKKEKYSRQMEQVEAQIALLRK